MTSSTNALLADLTRQLDREWALSNAAAFYDYVVAVRDLIDRGLVNPPDAAQAIAGTMFMPGVDDDPLREEITIVAGDLETGQRHPKHTWSYLLRLIDELGKQLA